MTQLSDWDLFRASAADDAVAFSELVERHWRPAVAFCRQVLGDHHRAEDSVQRGFLNLWRARDRKYEERAEFRTLLYRVLLNLCINDMQRRDRAKPFSTYANGDDAPEARVVDRTSPDPASALERAELKAVIADAVALLSPNHRAALYLREYEGMAYDEISAVLEATLAEVKIWIHRARRKLAVLLQPYLEKGELPR